MKNPLAPLTNLATRLYRRSVPARGRTILWVFRHYLRAVFGRAPAHVRNAHLAELYFLFGRTTPTVRLENGIRLRVDIRDGGVGRPMFDTGRYEPAETAYLLGVLGPGMTFVDVGANIGYYTVLAGRRVGPGGRVVAFEPDPHNYGLLAANVRLNRVADRVTLVGKALGAAPGTATLWKSGHNFGDHRLGDWQDGRAGTAVDVVTLDAALGGLGCDAIDVLKIDVQGHEPAVFAGMADVLRRRPPRRILLEFWPHGIRASGHDPAGFLGSLRAAGYRFHILSDAGTVRPVELAEILAGTPEFDPARPDANYVNLVLEHD